MPRLFLTLALLLAATPAWATDFAVTSYGPGTTCDAKETLLATLTLGSPIITAPAGTWSGGDAGKKIWCIPQFNGQFGVGIPPTATIVSVDNSGQIHASANAANTGASVVSGFCAWATQDDTAAFTSAFNAACATTSARIIMPTGGCAVSARIYNNNGTGCQTAAPSLIGAGQLATVIYIMPNFTIPGDGTGMLIQAVGYGARFAEFGFTGLNWPAPMIANQEVIRFTQTTKLNVENIRGYYNGSAVEIAGTAAVGFRTSTNGTYVRGLRVQDTFPGNKMVACHLVGTAGSFYDSVCSNMAINLLVENNQGRDSITAPLNWFGGIVDEPGMAVRTGGQINMIGTSIFGNDGFTLIPGIEVSGGSKVWIRDSNVGRFNAVLNTGGYAATISSDSYIYSSGTTWRGNTGGNTNKRAIINNGKFVDGGSNDYKLCGPTNACVTKSAAQLVQGHQPVRQ